MARREHQAQLDRGHDRAPAADPQHPPPAIPVLPPAPDFTRACARRSTPAAAPGGLREIRSEREAAARMCQGCPVLPDCTQWSLALPLSDPAIYGGHVPQRAHQRRRAWLAAVARQIRSRRLPWPQGTRLTFQYRVPGPPQRKISGGHVSSSAPARSRTQAQGWRSAGSPVRPGTRPPPSPLRRSWGRAPARFNPHVKV